MAEGISRRGFLRRAALGDDRGAIRPPGAHPDRFTDLCRDCDLCMKACPEAVLAPDDGGRPRFDPSLGECTFCGECASVCPTDALMAERLAEWPWRAEAGAACLSAKGVFCRSCQDVCDARAISFRPQIGGSAAPVIDLGQCTGCGACVPLCPVGAIQLRT